MKAPVGLLSDRTVLRQQDGGALPRQVLPRCTECRQCKEKHGFPAGVQKVCKSVQSPRKRKIHDESYDSSWDFGALEGTRITGPLIKSAGRAHISICGSNVISPFYGEVSQFLAVWFVHPVSDFATKIHPRILCDRAKSVQ